MDLIKIPLQIDNSVIRLLSYSGGLALIAVSLAYVSPFRRALTPIAALGGAIAAIEAYRRNQLNKDIEIYLKLKRQTEDGLIADYLTSQEIAQSKDIQNDLLRQLAELEERQADLHSRLAEF